MCKIVFSDGECKIAGILWNAAFKAWVEWEVAFSQQLYIPAATEAKHFFVWVYILLQEAEKMGLKPWSSSLHVPIPYHGVSSLLTCAGKKNLEDERGPKSHQLAHDELCVASGVLLFICFFPLTILPHCMRLFKGFFPMGLLATCPK